MIWNLNFSEIAAMHCLVRLRLIHALAPVDGFRLGRKASRWKSRAAMARLFPIGTHGLCIPRCIPCGLMWVDVGWGCEHRAHPCWGHGGAVPWPGEVMSPESSTIPRISDLTLALLEAWLSLAWTHWMQTRWQSSSI